MVCGATGRKSVKVLHFIILQSFLCIAQVLEVKLVKHPFQFDLILGRGGKKVEKFGLEWIVSNRDAWRTLLPAQNNYSHTLRSSNTILQIRLQPLQTEILDELLIKPESQTVYLCDFSNEAAGDETPAQSKNPCWRWALIRTSLTSVVSHSAPSLRACSWTTVFKSCSGH